MIENELKRRVAEKVLARVRAERSDPDWRPTGLFGGGWEVGLKTRARLKRLKQRGASERPPAHRKEHTMTPEEIERLSPDELLDVMRREGVPFEISMFATIHHRGDDRPDGYTEDDLDQINDDLEDGDVRRWRLELAEHFAKRG